MTNTTMNTTVNEKAAEKANRIFNAKDIKDSIANLAKIGSGAFKKITENIHDISNMDDTEVRNTVHQTFASARAEIQEEINTLNKIPSFQMGMEVETLEQALITFVTIEKEILADKDINIVKRVLIMFWTGVKYICGLILKSCITAGKFVAACGIRIIAVGLDFIIKIIKTTVKLFKTIKNVLIAVKVSKDGKEQEIDSDSTRPGENK